MGQKCHVWNLKLQTQGTTDLNLECRSWTNLRSYNVNENKKKQKQKRKNQSKELCHWCFQGIFLKEQEKELFGNSLKQLFPYSLSHASIYWEVFFFHYKNLCILWSLSCTCAIHLVFYHKLRFLDFKKSFKNTSVRYKRNKCYVTCWIRKMRKLASFFTGLD